MNADKNTKAGGKTECHKENIDNSSDTISQLDPVSPQFLVFLHLTSKALPQPFEGTAPEIRAIKKIRQDVVAIVLQQRVEIHKCTHV